MTRNTKTFNTIARSHVERFIKQRAPRFAKKCAWLSIAGGGGASRHAASLCPLNQYPAYRPTLPRHSSVFFDSFVSLLNGRKSTVPPLIYISLSRRHLFKSGVQSKIKMTFFGATIRIILLQKYCCMIAATSYATIFASKLHFSAATARNAPSTPPESPRPPGRSIRLSYYQSFLLVPSYHAVIL